MTEVTRHEQGSFSWAELATSDPKAAKSFYGALFGWSHVDNPMGPDPDDVYTRLQVGGKDVGALYKMRPEQSEQGIPPNWGTYFAVTNVDEATNKVKASGGNVLAPPFDVMDYGRMSVVQGPEGATFSLWQAGTHGGFERMGEDNTASWTELQTRDAEKSGKFLSNTIGFNLKTDPKGEYTELQRGGTSVGGIRPIGKDEQMPPHWLVYFQVANADATIKKAQSLGGRVLMPATDVPNVGRFAVLSDPQGAAFAIITLAGH